MTLTLTNIISALQTLSSNSYQIKSYVSDKKYFFYNFDIQSALSASKTDIKDFINLATTLQLLKKNYDPEGREIYSFVHLLFHYYFAFHHLIQQKGHLVESYNRDRDAFKSYDGEHEEDTNLLGIRISRYISTFIRWIDALCETGGESAAVYIMELIESNYLSSPIVIHAYEKLGTMGYSDAIQKLRIELMSEDYWGSSSFAAEALERIGTPEALAAVAEWQAKQSKPRWT